MEMYKEAAAGCAACRSGQDFGMQLTMAFQPIVNTALNQVWAYEALVRGTEGQPASQVLSQVNENNRYVFDQTCRVKAIELAARLGIAQRGARLSVNFMPGAVYSPAACIRRTLEAARLHRFPLEQIVFEITEGERVVDIGHLRRIASAYAEHGFTLALDDFGAGFSGLNLLSEIDGIGLVKLDGALIQGISGNARAECIVAAVGELCRTLNVKVLAECVETIEDYATLRRLGIELMQGYLFARPALEALPEVDWPARVPLSSGAGLEVTQDWPGTR